MLRTERGVEELVAQHWKYVAGVISAEWDAMVAATGYDDNHRLAHLRLLEYHFKTAFTHGYKHAMEDMNETR